MNQFFCPFMSEDDRQNGRRDRPCANRRNRVLARERVSASPWGRNDSGLTLKYDGGRS